MSRPPRLPRRPVLGVALAVAATAILLSGCTGETPEPTGTASPGPSETSSPSAGPSETPVPTEEPVPFEIACDVLLTPDQVYEFNPNFGADPGYEAAAAGVAAVVDEAGTACGWLNQTSGEVIEIGVATPPPAALESRKNEAALGSNPVPTYGTPPAVDGYFSQVGAAGEAQVFTGPYWIVLDSPAFFEPGDAQQLVTAVLANLPEAP